MSQFQPPQQVPPPAAQGGNGLAIAAIICAVAGFIIPFVGIVAIVLAIIAMMKPVPRGRGKGLQVAALVLAIVGTLFNCVAVTAGILLPGLGRARHAARQVVSGERVREIGVALHTYAADYNDWFPPTPDGLNRLVAAGLVTSDMLVTPHARERPEVSYFYLPPDMPLSDYENPSRVIMVYENPQLVRGKVNVLFMDGRVETMSDEELNRQLAAQGAPAAPAAADSP